MPPHKLPERPGCHPVEKFPRVHHYQVSVKEDEFPVSLNRVPYPMQLLAVARFPLPWRRAILLHEFLTGTNAAVLVRHTLVMNDHSYIHGFRRQAIVHN